MSTPEIPSVKYSPFGGGINKSLLTPCRQVGLSRKRKTPNNNFSKSFSEDLNGSSNSNNITINSINSYSDNDGTPKTRNKLSNRRKKNDNLLLNFKISTPVSESDNVLKNQTKPEVLGSQRNFALGTNRKNFQTFISEDLFESDEGLPNTQDEIIEDNGKTYTRNCSTQISEICPTRKNEKVDLNFKYENEAKSKVETDITKSDDFQEQKGRNLIEKSGSQPILSDDSDDDFIFKRSKKRNQESNRRDKLKIMKRTLLKKSSSCLEVDNSPKSKCIKNCKIQLQKLDSNKMHSDKNKTGCEKTSNEPVDQCSKSSILDDSESDFFTSTPEEERLKRKNLEKKIKLVESQVKQKQLTLENLQRASIYKNKHNIEDLKKLSSLWLDGCVDALKELLTHLQAHGPINLRTLLNNMHIPKKIIAKLPLQVE